MSLHATQLKREWMGMPDKFFEPLTFGELAVGDKFISLPEPGDNDGHGGFRESPYIFIKIEQQTPKTKGGSAYGVPHGSSLRLIDGVRCDQPHSMYILRVQ